MNRTGVILFVLSVGLTSFCAAMLGYYLRGPQYLGVITYLPLLGLNFWNVCRSTNIMLRGREG